MTVRACKIPKSITETLVFWKSLPGNTQTSKFTSSMPGKKSAKGQGLSTRLVLTQLTGVLGAWCWTVTGWCESAL